MFMLKIAPRHTRLNVENKVVPPYANPSAGQRCLVFLPDEYLSKLPQVAFEKQIFCLRPKQGCPTPGNLWYDAMAVGKEKL